MILSFAWVGGCSSSSGARTAPVEETLRIGAKGNGEAPRVIADSLFAEPLVAIDWSGRPAERLATEWQWQDEGQALRLQLLEGTGLYLLGARVYDPETGRFLQPDPLVANPADPQSFTMTKIMGNIRMSK